MITPGPWRFCTNPQPNGCPIVGSGGLMVAMLAHSVNEPDQKGTALANAALIAAAPEMLAALKEADHTLAMNIPETVGGHPFPEFETVVTVRKAIAKAEGRDES